MRASLERTGDVYLDARQTSALEQRPSSLSAGYRRIRAAGNQRGPAQRAHALQRDSTPVDSERRTALHNREAALAQWAKHHMTDARHGLAVEVCIPEGFGNDASVGGGVVEADDVFHEWSSCGVGLLLIGGLRSRLA